MIPPAVKLSGVCLSCWVPSVDCPRVCLQNTMAQAVIDRVPSVEMVRFVNSGTEACLSVLRLMRAYTGREKVRCPCGLVERAHTGQSCMFRQVDSNDLPYSVPSHTRRLEAPQVDKCLTLTALLSCLRAAN